MYIIYLNFIMRTFVEVSSALEVGVFQEEVFFKKKSPKKQCEKSSAIFI